MLVDMDRVVAERMGRELATKSVGGWHLDEPIGHGKSALVFRGARGGVVAAVKVFDRELVERFGRGAQRERVERERLLVGRHHPNLIQILDVGEDEAHDVFFVVMDLVDVRNLDDLRHEVPTDKIRQILSQVASAGSLRSRTFS